MCSGACIRSPHLESTIDVDDLPSDIVRIPRSEEHYHIPNPDRQPKPPEKNARLYLIASLLEEFSRHVGLDNSWSHGVNCDPAGAQLYRERPRKRIDRPFAGRVVCLTEAPPLAGDGTHVDDLPRPVRKHVRDHRARHVKDPGDVRLENSSHIVLLKERQQVVTDDPGSDWG